MPTNAELQAEIERLKKERRRDDELKWDLLMSNLSDIQETLATQGQTQVLQAQDLSQIKHSLGKFSQVLNGETGKEESGLILRMIKLEQRHRREDDSTSNRHRLLVTVVSGVAVTSLIGLWEVFKKFIGKGP